MKYFIFTFLGDGLPIAYRLQQEGHDVVVGQVLEKADLHSKREKQVAPEDSVTQERRLSLFDGMLTKIPAWELVDKIKEMQSYTDCFVFFDRNNLFHFAQALSHLPIAGNFPTEEDYLFEQDRNKAKQFVDKYYGNLHVAEVHEFAKVEEAEAFLAHTDKHWVLKGKDDSAETVVPDILDSQLSAKQILHALHDHRDTYEQNGFILELRIDPVIELTPGKLYFDGEPLGMIIDIENKPFGSGNISVQTGCAQETIIPLSMNNKLHDIAFPKIADEMAKHHKGLFYWDASLLIDQTSGEMYFGEFCPNRPGYDMIFCELAMCEKAGDYFSLISQKKNPYTLGKISTSIRIFNPQKDDDGRSPRNSPIDFDPTYERNIWLWDVYKKDQQLMSAGDDMNVAVITGVGKTLEEAGEKMYATTNKFSFMGAYYRPKFDFFSREYSTSIPNRLQYGIEKGLFELPT